MGQDFRHNDKDRTENSWKFAQSLHWRVLISRYRNTLFGATIGVISVIREAPPTESIEYVGSDGRRESVEVRHGDEYLGNRKGIASDL